MKENDEMTEVLRSLPAEKKQQEEALQTQARVLESMAEGVSVCDQEGIITFTNAAFDEMFGYPRGDLKGKHVTSLNSDKNPEANGRIFKTVIEHLERQGKWSGEFENCRQDGSVFYTHARISTLEIAGSKYWVTVQEDITGRKRTLEEIELLNAHLAERTRELEAANRDLKAVNDELEAFNYTVSHDLRLPLTNIQLCSQVLLEHHGNQLDEEGKKFIQNIIDCTVRMTDLTACLLEFASIAQQELHQELVDLSGMAREIATSLRFKEPERKVVFEFAEEIVAQGDGPLLRTVLENLLGNAWKFTGKKDPAVIEFGILKLAGRPAYFVRDNGVGLDLSKADKLFQTFQRLDSGGDFEGHGIGLATAQRVIQRHGGKIWVEGEPGKGATFYFTLG